MGYALTNLMMVVGITCGWYSPVIGLMAYYFFSVIKPYKLWFWVWGGVEPSYAKYVAISVLIGWVIHGFGDWSKMRGAWIPMLGLGFYLLWGFMLTHTVAMNKVSAEWFLGVNLKIGLMTLVTLTVLRDKKSIMLFVYCIVAFMGIFALVLNQLYYQSPVFVQSHMFADLDNNGWAMLNVMGMPLAFYTGIYVKKWYLKAACFLASLLMVHAVLFSMSRGGQLGLIIVGVMIFVTTLLILPRKIVTIAIALGFVVLALQLAGPEVRARFTTIFVDQEERDGSANSRLESWAAAIKCMKQNPMGLGPRQFELVAHNYGLDRGKTIHNTYLQTGTDYGIPGLIGLMTFFIVTWVRTLFMTMTGAAKRMVWPRYVGIMCCTSMAGYFVCAIFLSLESVELTYVVLVMSLCTLTHVRTVHHVDSYVPELAQVPAPGTMPQLATT